MKNRFLHIAAFACLAFLLLPLASLVLLQSLQWCLKTSVGERMENHSVITVSVPVSRAIWHKKEKELTIDGRLFDVDSYRINNNLLTATGFFDDKETSVVYLLSLLATPETSKALLQFVLVLQCFVATVLVFLVCPAKGRLIHQTAYVFFLPAPACLMKERPPQP